MQKALRWIEPRGPILENASNMLIKLQEFEMEPPCAGAARLKTK